MTWNVWWRFGGHWQEREQGIVATLEDLAPDVVGLQEVWGDDTITQAGVLGEALSMHSVFASPSLPPPPDPPESADQAGIALGVALLSRWPIVEAGEEVLPATHRSPPPVALVATIDHPAGPLHVVVAAVEWEPAFSDDHLAQTAALARILRDPALDGPLPVILVADLNAPPEAVPLRPLTEVMTDAWTAGGGVGEGVTLSRDNPFAPSEAVEQIDQRIDYILARPGRSGTGVDAVRAFVAEPPLHRLAPSDHEPVVADLVLPGEQGGGPPR